jgi:putative ATP-binding cassette transporter
MDEATSALDELSEAKMMEFLRTDLAPVTVIGVARRSGLDEYFEREINVRRRHGPARATVCDLHKGPRGAPFLNDVGREG